MLKHDAESYDLCDSKVEFVLKDEEEGDWSTSPTRVKHIGEIDPESLSSGTDFKLMELVVPELVSTFTESSKESLNVLPDSAPPSEVDLDENGEAAPPVTKENPYSCGFVAFFYPFLMFSSNNCIVDFTNVLRCFLAALT